MEVMTCFYAGGWNGRLHLSTSAYDIDVRTSDGGVLLYAGSEPTTNTFRLSHENDAKSSFSWVISLWPEFSFETYGRKQWTSVLGIPWCWMGLTIPLAQLWSGVVTRRRLAAIVCPEDPVPSANYVETNTLHYAKRDSTVSRWFSFVVRLHDRVSGLIGGILLGVGGPITVNAIRHPFRDDLIAGVELCLLGGVISMFAIWLKPTLRRLS